MPNYDYICGAGHVIEVRHGMNEKPEYQCNALIWDDAHMATTCDLPMTRHYAPSGGEFVLGGDPDFARNQGREKPPGKAGGNR